MNFQDIAQEIDESHEKLQEPPRPYLGGSIIGHHCDRWLWLSFRWAVIEKFPGRVLRLFRRGHREEDLIIEDLKRIGVRVENEQGDVTMPPHCGGHIDGEAVGIPTAPKTRHLLEFKTHALKSFDDLEKNGVHKSKPIHWCQMQIYMHGRKLTRALYYAVCKNDDRIYTERVEYDKAAAEQLIERARNIVSAERIPDPISSDPSWYQCKWCPAYNFCHKAKPTQEVNCRTCAFSTAENDGTWSCARHESGGIPYEFQLEGCECHVLHPDIVPWEREASDNPHEAVYIINGKPVRNGEGDAYTFSSKEIIANPSGCTHDLVKDVKDTFPGAKVVG